MLLSIEDPPPAADPNHEISLKGVDLSNSTLDDHNPVPNFSIRDYVFNARNKDIKTNWPFSRKSLQLCLKHGVKDILPPFQCLDCMKNKSNERGSAKSNSSEKENIINSDVEPSSKVGNIDFSDKQLPDNSNNPCPQEVCAKTSEKPESHLPKKPEVSKPPSMKKCKLILKVGPSGVQPSSTLHGASTMVEPMAASKLCPVCKTFSSSSNTTLNAHIDQCLSMDSPTEPSSKSRVIKRRIKPRKTRLMVDIYATAPHCTLEELDRRNGRIWSEKSTLPTIQEDAVDCGEEKKQSDGFVQKGDEGAVYVDANGTKLRILNKISDTTSGSNLGVNPCRLGKHLRGGKESKPLSTYKKKEKHSKHLKLASQKQYNTRLASRVLGDQEKDVPIEESCKENENMDANVAQSLKSREQIINSGTMIPKWPSSKRTDLLKRRIEGDQSSSRESELESSYAERINNCFETHLSPQKGKGIDNSSYEGPINEYHGQPTLKKHLVFKSFGSRSAASMDLTFSVDQSASCEPKVSKNSPVRAKNDDEYYDKHLEHHCRIDEDASQVPLKRSTILKIRKKKSPSSISHRNELTKDRGNRENPPPRAGPHFEDGLVNVVPPSGGEIVIEQSLGTGAESVMSLAKSFDQDFYLIGDTDMETEMDPTDLQGNYFSGVDPITIPGPPGSFLPSPGRMSSEEDYQGNSSLTTNRLQSSVDHLEMVDRDSSNSPKSANSTISNSLIARSDLKSIEDLSLESRVSQDEIIKLGFSNEIAESTLGFQDGRACCCSEKKGVSVNYRESQLLNLSVMSLFPAHTLDKQPSSYPNSTIFPIAESGLDLVSVKVPIKPPIYEDVGSPSPSSPSPVLRLMGKNLMVVNNDENLNHSPNSKSQAGPPSNSIHQVTPFYGNKGIDLDLDEYKPNVGSLNRSSLNSPFSPLSYVERVEPLLGTTQRNKDAIIPKHRKEVIVIDTPENEAHTDAMNVTRTRSGGVAIPSAGYYNSRHLNSFYSYQWSDFSPSRGSHVIPNATSPMPPSSLCPMGWTNGVLEGSNMLPRSSLTSSQLTNHARSSLYYPPSKS